ncbi:XRE family transcriptional regulator [Rhodococcus gannanensis]|uniref:XRE family transcriptional regulator n=1 Tax=Rhodococcus gannanensis TaxID=1960308 RepID=A0ABW4P277_9NOCA
MEGIESLARAVVERRRRLNLTLDQVKAAGGPSDVTTGKIEKAQIPEPSARTLRRLDVALRWVDGSAARVLTGSAPVPVEDLSSPGGVDADADSVTLSLALVGDLSDLAKRYEQLASDHRGEPFAVELGRVNERFDLLVDRIMRAWLTVQLERRTKSPGAGHAAGHAIGDPVVEMLLGDYLDRSSQPPTAEDADDLRYLRWLTGRADDVDTPTQQRYLARWRARQETAG